MGTIVRLTSTVKHRGSESVVLGSTRPSWMDSRRLGTDERHPTRRRGVFYTTSGLGRWNLTLTLIFFPLTSPLKFNSTLIWLHLTQNYVTLTTGIKSSRLSVSLLLRRFCVSVCLPSTGTLLLRLYFYYGRVRFLTDLDGFRPSPFLP